MIRRTLLLTSLLIVALAAPAHAQYPTGLTLDRAAVAPGGEVGVAVCCYAPGSTTTFSIGGAVLGTAIVNDDGVASGTFSVPPDVPSGSTAVMASGVTADGSVADNRAAVAVGGVTAATAARVGGLPVTGSGAALPLSILAVFLLGGGGLVVLAARRRSTESAGRS